MELLLLGIFMGEVAVREAAALYLVWAGWELGLLYFESGEEEGDDEGDSEKWYGEKNAGLPVTQSNDPRSGGHFALGASKAPHRPSREGSGVVVHVVSALKVAHSKHTRLVVESESPFPNGLTTVGGAKTRFLI
jgi:hypothetical protein